jgi:hypothetical protein
MVKPLEVMMLGSQVPSPMATPKNAEKQIMPAMTRIGNIVNTTANGSLLVSLAASFVSGSFGPAMPMRPSASLPRPWVAR